MTSCPAYDVVYDLRTQNLNFDAPIPEQVGNMTMCCGQLWVRHMICGQTCDELSTLKGPFRGVPSR